MKILREYRRFPINSVSYLNNCKHWLNICGVKQNLVKKKCKKKTVMKVAISVQTFNLLYED